MPIPAPRAPLSPGFVSACSGWGNQLAIDSNFQPVTFGAHSVSLLRMEQKYGPAGLDRYLSKEGAVYKEVVHALAIGVPHARSTAAPILPTVLTLSRHCRRLRYRARVARWCGRQRHDGRRSPHDGHLPHRRASAVRWRSHGCGEQRTLRRCC